MSLFTNLNFLKNFETSIDEDFNFFEEKINISKTSLSQIYTLDNLKQIFNLVIDDNLIIFIDDDYDSSKVTFRSLTDIDNNFNQLNLENFEDDDKFYLRIKVEKTNTNEYKIYSFKNFIKWISTNENILSIYEKIKIFEETAEKIKIHILDEENHFFYTNKFIFFSNPEFLQDDSSSLNKELIFRNHKDNCHYTGLNINNFSPTDFKLIKKSTNKSLNLCFDKFCFLLTLIYIVDISEIINNDSLYYKLDGYRTVKDTINFKKISTKAFTTYYNIFTWIYLEQSTNISDRIGLARNVISLHIKNNDLTEIKGDLYTSIKSNFDIYLKENVQRYLEVKNQVSNFMYDMSLKAENYSNSFIDVFKTNFLIFISYFLSIFVVTAIDKGKFINMFSKEVTIITILILVMSYIYKIFTVRDLKEKITRFEKKYQLLKTRYSDILEEDNLNSLFTNDEEFINDISYMNSSLKKFSSLWTGSIIAFLIISICLYISNNPSDFIELTTILFFSLFGLFLKIKSFL